ncbi:hypothetical protein MTO96_002934 [Rhipicephalus appendiculatus]
MRHTAQRRQYPLQTDAGFLVENVSFFCDLRASHQLRSECAASSNYTNGRTATRDPRPINKGAPAIGDALGGGATDVRLVQDGAYFTSGKRGGEESVCATRRWMLDGDRACESAHLLSRPQMMGAVDAGERVLWPPPPPPRMLLLHHPLLDSVTQAPWR